MTTSAPGGYVIQPFAEQDARRAAELEQILFSEQDPWSEGQFRDYLGAAHVRMWAARESGDGADGADGAGDAAEAGALLGYAVLAQLGPATDPEFELYDIAVDPEHQGRGLGRALLRELLGVADTAGGPVFLEVATGNIPARTLYEAHGFAVVGMRPNYYHPSGESAYSMVRPARTADPAASGTDEETSR